MKKHSRDLQLLFIIFSLAVLIFLFCYKLFTPILQMQNSARQSEILNILTENTQEIGDMRQGEGIVEAWWPVYAQNGNPEMLIFRFRAEGYAMPVVCYSLFTFAMRNIQIIVESSGELPAYNDILYNKEFLKAVGNLDNIRMDIISGATYSAESIAGALQEVKAYAVTVRDAIGKEK